MMQTTTMWKALIIVVVLFRHGSVAESEPIKSEPCRNRLSPLNPLQLMNENLELIANITECEVLKRQYPTICLKDLGQRECCRACSRIDTSCLDSPTALFPTIDKDGTRTYKKCADYIKDSRCHCKQVLQADEPIYVKEKCCASCQGVDTRGCDCRDKLSEINAITWEGGSITSCEVLRAQYPELCRVYGRRNGPCCKSCKGVSTECLDTRFQKWTYEGREMECPEYIAENICHCLDGLVRRKCCNSCAGFKGREEECCDRPNFTSRIKVFNKYGECDRCTCKELRSRGPEFMEKACQRNLIKRNCCQSCALVHVLEEPENPEAGKEEAGLDKHL